MNRPKHRVLGYILSIFASEILWLGGYRCWMWQFWVWQLLAAMFIAIGVEQLYQNKEKRNQK